MMGSDDTDDNINHQHHDNNNQQQISTVEIPISSSLPSIPITMNGSDQSFPLDPPSCSDVVSNPGDDSVAEKTPLSKPNTNPILHISVSDPVTESDKSPNSLVPTTYVTYLITTITNYNYNDNDGDNDNANHKQSKFRSQFSSVRRRFRDVVALAERLSVAHRGLFVPVRPDKGVVESQTMQKQEFVEQRRAAIEKYLRRLAAHPVIRESEELRLFLHKEGRLGPQADVASRVVDSVVNLPRQVFGRDAVEAGRVRRDLLRRLKELKQAVVNDWGAGTATGARPPVVDEDKDFLERKERMQYFQHQISNSSQMAEGLVKAQQDIGETMGQLGLAFVKLTKCETDQAIYDSQRIRAGDYRCLATATVKASRLYRELNSQTVKHLDTLHEYLGLMLAVHSAFSDRSGAFLTVQTLTTELSSLHSRAEKLEAAASKIFGGDRSRILKVEELKQTIRATEDAKSYALGEFERIKENNRFELERFDRGRHDDFLSMLKGLVVNQVGYAEKMADTWQKVADETSRYAQDRH